MFKIISNNGGICRFTYSSSTYIYYKKTNELYREYYNMRNQTFGTHMIDYFEKEHVITNLYKYLRVEKLKRIINNK